MTTGAVNANRVDSSKHPKVNAGISTREEIAVIECKK